MLTEYAAPADEAYFDDLRDREFRRLAAHDSVYLDYAGSALYADSHLRAHHALLTAGLFGNPHSEHLPSRASADTIASARRRVLSFLDADEDSYVVCFTANTSAAVKLVAESYPFEPGRVCVLTADNHNSVNGLREFARRAGSSVVYLPLDATLRLKDPEVRLRQHAGTKGGLFAFPAQSNFSGVQHPLSLVHTAHRAGMDVLVDLASFAPAHAFSLRRCPADFVALSFYKVFGYPTGIGALVARREALERLVRPWFSGGTVAYASVQLARHQLLERAEGFEDGTPNFLAIGALDYGFDMLEDVAMPRLTRRVERLTSLLLDELCALRHSAGAPMIRVYGPPDMEDRGGTVAFNVLSADGQVVPYWDVEEAATASRVALRGGCFCNPGASEAAFGFDPLHTAGCLARLGRGFTIERFKSCLDDGTAVGAVRASFGLANNAADVKRAIAVIARFRS
jgi:selenocysteine lyase/cysteine desulfurase